MHVEKSIFIFFLFHLLTIVTYFVKKQIKFIVIFFKDINRVSTMTLKDAFVF